MKQQTTTKTTYTIEGIPVYDHITRHSITVDGSEKGKLEEIARTGRFTFHMPEMWAEKGGQREPAYDVECVVSKIERLTEITTRVWDELAIDALARDLQ